MTVLVETRADLTLESARRVAWDGEGVELGAQALAAMARGRSAWSASSSMTRGHHLWRDDGSGPARREETDARTARALGRHVAGTDRDIVGDPLPDRVVRAIVLARLANFVEGHAAVSPEIAQRVAALLDEEKMPVVPTKGQGGAGEILSLSHLFTGLAEQAKPALKDVMCLVNGSPSATGLVTDAALVAANRLDVAARVFALSFEAFNAPLDHLDPALGDYWNNPHDRWALGRLRQLVGDGHGGGTAPLSGAGQLSHPSPDAGPGPARGVARRRGRGRIAPGRDG